MSPGLLDHIATPSAPAPRNIPGGPRFAGLRTIGTLLLIAGLIVAAVAANHAWTQHRHGNPDPNGVRLSVMRQAIAALPAAQPHSAEEVQPFRWIPTNCGSMPGKHPGWSNEIVSVSAGAKNIPVELQAAKTAMAARG
jgi:hypothetical protein